MNKDIIITILFSYSSSAISCNDIKKVLIELMANEMGLETVLMTLENGFIVLLDISVRS